MHPPQSVGLPNEFYGELNLSWIRSGLAQQTSTAVDCAVAIQHVCVEVTQTRHVKIGVVQDIEELRPELYIEALRNPPDVVVLKYGKVEIRQARPHQSVAADIASKVVATQIPRRECGPDTRRRGVAVGCPKSLVWRHWHREATGLDVQRTVWVTVEIQVNRI